MFLNNFGYEADSANGAIEALARFNPLLHDLVLTDNSLPGMRPISTSEGVCAVNLGQQVLCKPTGDPVAFCRWFPEWEISRPQAAKIASAD